MDDIKYNNNDDNNSDISDQNIVKGVRHVLSALLHTPCGSHNLIVYSDIRVLRKIYPVYVKSLLDNNEIVLILTYYDHPSMIRQILQNGTNKKSDSIDLKRYVHDGSLVIVDSLMSYFNQNHGYEINNDGKLNFLSLIRILLNHGIKNNKNGTHPVDYKLVISDIRMPHMNGYEFVQQVKMKKPDVKVFLMTAFEFTDCNDISYSSHIERFLEKPVSLLKLNEIVLKHIGNNPILNQESYISTDRTNGTTDGHVS